MLQFGRAIRKARSMAVTHYARIFAYCPALTGGARRHRPRLWCRCAAQSCPVFRSKQCDAPDCVGSATDPDQLVRVPDLTSDGSAAPKTIPWE